MSSQFARAGDEWEQSQRALLADAKLRGERGSRTWRICEVAAGVDDEKFFADVRALFTTPAVWQITPPSTRAARGRALAFRMVSRMATAVEELLASRHRLCPFVTFLVLTSPQETKDKLLGLPPCLLDAFTKELLKSYHGVCDEECLATLEAMAMQLPTDISEIEARHASLRRLLYTSSVQTHRMDVEDLSAQWMVLQHRLRRGHYQTRQARSVKRNIGKAKASDRRRSNIAQGKRLGMGQRRSLGGPVEGVHAHEGRGPPAVR